MPEIAQNAVEPEESRLGGWNSAVNLGHAGPKSRRKRALSPLFDVAERAQRIFLGAAERRQLAALGGFRFRESMLSGGS
jgi:hypothetical protein